MNAGDTFLIHGDDHLWMVISDPQLEPSTIVVVRFVSWQPWLEQSSVIRAGEHPFVKHDTCVNYAAARAVSIDRINDQMLKPKQPLRPALLRRIQTSAEDSDIPSMAYNILRRQNLFDP